MQIETERLILIACDRAMLDQLTADRGAFAATHGVVVPEDFPVEPGGIAYWRSRLQREWVDPRWVIWLAVRKADRLVIGDGGFKGPPDERGEVETGYALIEHARGRGYGREFVGALIGMAFSDPAVTAVLAETLVDNAASIGLLRALGMQHAGDYHDPEEGDIIQWRLDSPNR